MTKESGCRTINLGTRMAHSRSLGFARDDKKERVVEWERTVAKGKRQLLRRRDAFSINHRLLHRPLRYPSTAIALVRKRSRALPRHAGAGGMTKESAVWIELLTQTLKPRSSLTSNGPTKSSALIQNIGAGVSARVTGDGTQQSPRLRRGLHGLPARV